MSTKTKRTDQSDRERLVRYLKAALRRSPVGEADRIMELRSRFIGNPRAVSRAATVDQGPSTAEQRSILERRLQGIRSSFWTAELSELQQLLTFEQTIPFADLQHAFFRLRIVTANRHRFAEVASVASAAPAFFKAFREVLITDPQKAAELRERVMARTRDLRALRKVIRRVRSKMPDVYELEADWLRSLERLKPSGNRSLAEILTEQSESSATSSTDLSWVVYLIIFLTIMILRIVF